MFVVAEVVGDLTLKSGLREPLGQLLEQPALAGQMQALGLSPAHELVDQPVVHRLRRHRLRRLGGLHLGHVVAGHRCIFHDRELHRTFYSPWEVGRLHRLVTLAEVGVQLVARSGLGSGRSFFRRQRPDRRGR